MTGYALQPPERLGELNVRIAELRCAHPETRQLAAAAAETIFLTTGEMPSTRVVRQAIGAGSLTTIAAGLREYQARLRDLAERRVALPALPDRVSAQFGQALSALWEEATGAAREAAKLELASDRAALDVEVDDAHALADEAREESFAATRLLEARGAEIERLEVAIAAANARETQLSAALQDSLEQKALFSERLRSSQQQSDADREAFVARQRLLEASLTDTKARWSESDKRLLLEVDALRTQIKDAAAHLSRAQAALQAQREELSGVRLTAERELGEVKGRAGALEAQVQAARAELRARSEQHETLVARHASESAMHAAASAALETTLRGRIDALADELETCKSALVIAAAKSDADAPGAPSVSKKN
jgi:chromosome segregation ATPase